MEEDRLSDRPQKSYPGKLTALLYRRQIGEGNFMRGFIDWQIHRLNEETDFNGSAVVVPPRRGSVTAFQEQDGLYTLYLEGFREGREVRDSAVENPQAEGGQTLISTELIIRNSVKHL
ncbi:hypothetical protein DT075_12305 [Bacillus licheniformis]|nr:hypothetical protein DT075_12305 [Bacillus licheniformis]